MEKPPPWPTSTRAPACSNAHAYEPPAATVSAPAGAVAALPGAHTLTVALPFSGAKPAGQAAEALEALKHSTWRLPGAHCGNAGTASR